MTYLMKVAVPSPRCHRFVGWINVCLALLALAMATPARAVTSSVLLSLESGTQYAGQVISLDLIYSGEGSSGAQWDIKYSAADFASLQVLPGSAAVSANKGVVCSPSTGMIRCLALGMNSTDMQPGVMAVVNATLAPATVNSPSSRTATLQVLNPIATTGAGSAIPVSANSGAVTILRPAPTTVTPASISMRAQQQQTFTADTTVTWSLNPASGRGTINSQGRYTAPSLIASARQVTVIATNSSNSSLTATATVNLYPVGVSVSPTSTSLKPSESRQFTAAVTDSPDPSVQWTVTPSVGTVSLNGRYTAPTTISYQQTVTVAAVSVYDPTKSANAVVTLSPGGVTPPGDVTPPTGDKVGVFRRGTWLLDANGNGLWDSDTEASLQYGARTDKPVVGDWDGDGNDEIGTYRNGTWYLDWDGDNQYTRADRVYYYGGSVVDIPVVGDWNGDGADEVGFFDPTTRIWALDVDGNGKWTQGVDKGFIWGRTAAAIPVIGDWNGDGRDAIGFFDPTDGVWALDIDGNGAWTPGVDRGFMWGRTAAAIPVTGDWNGDGQDKIGYFDPTDGIWALDVDGNRTWTPGVDKGFKWSLTAATRPVIGDWNADGKDTAGIFDPSQETWALDVDGDGAWTQGIDRGFYFGGTGAVPVVGAW